MTHPDTSIAETATCDASTAPFALSVLTVTKGNASKQLLVGANGKPIKGQGSLAISAGLLEHIQVAGLAGLQELLTGIRHDQALVHGVVKGSCPGTVTPIVPIDILKQAKPGTLAPGTAARSLEYVSYPNDVFLLMLDRDDNAEDPTKLSTAADLITLLAPLFPGLAEAGRVVTTSTSSAIRSKATGEWLIAPRGFHVYLLAQGNLQRFVDLLTVRLWNAGYGYCKLATPNAQTGVPAVLSRAVVDLAVFSPERLDYVAGARIAKTAPFVQDRGAPQLIPGPVLALDAVPDVTPEERQAYTRRLGEAKARLAPERFATVKAKVEAQEPTLAPAEVEALATQRLQHQDDCLLPGDFLLYFYHRKKAVAVRDLTADYDNHRLADPAEPTYRDGTDAIFHWRVGDWRINSFAHGLLKTYRAVPTPPSDPDEEDMQDLLEHAPALKGTPNSTPSSDETPPESLLAKTIAQQWQSTIAFDLHRQAFMGYSKDEGIFRELEDVEVDAKLWPELERRIPEGFYTKTLRNVKYLLRSRLHTRMRSGPSTLVPFRNGVLDIATKAWHQHRPDFHCTWQLPYDYAPQADCPTTKAWLAEACRGRDDQVQVLRSFLRAVVCGRNDIQRFLELIGPGGSGKGTFTRLTQGLVGLENVAVTELKYLESNRFETSNLIHKRLIVITDAEQWAGQVTTLKALTGGDSLRVERKNVQQHPSAVAEGLVLVAANEPITSADYTSGLDRRRIPVPFSHRPTQWRNLLEIKGDHFEGELASEFPGVVNWVLNMSKEEMEQHLLYTSTVAPTLAESHRRTLVLTNPLAAWADERLTTDPAPGETVQKDYRPPGVKVGVAVLEEEGRRYENENTWLYPNYVAYCKSTNNKALSLRRFTNLLMDLFVAQLHLTTVEQKTSNKGSHIRGIRFRWPSDDENISKDPDTYIPKIPFLITGTVSPPPKPPSGGGYPSPSEGCEWASEGYGEGLNAVGYRSEGSEGCSTRMYRENGGINGARTNASRDCAHTDARARTRIGEVKHSSQPSLPSLARDNSSRDSSPIPHWVRDQGAAEDEESWPEPPEKPLTPGEEFDLLFEGHMDAQEDRHMRTVLGNLGKKYGCKQCGWSVLLDKGAYRECDKCHWKEW